MSEEMRLYCAVWNDEDDAKIWAGNVVALPRTGEVLTFAHEQRYRVVRVEHALDLPNEGVQGVDVYVVPDERKRRTNADHNPAL